MRIVITAVFAMCCRPSNSLEKDLESILQTYGLKEEEEAKREADELKQKDWTPEGMCQATFRQQPR